jgi:hypothetical protein
VKAILRPRPRLALGLALLGLAAAAVASVHASSELRASERARAVTAAAEDLDVRFRRQMSALEATADDVSKAFSDAAPLPAIPSADLSPKERAKAERALGGAWERVKASLGGTKAPPGTRIALYEETSDAGAKEPFVLLGWADASGVHRTELVTWTGRLPAAMLLAEHARITAGTDSYGFAWFQPDGASEIRLHRLDAYNHSEVDPEGGGSTVEAVRLAEVSAPFVLDGDFGARVRCDLDEAGPARALPERVVPGGARPSDGGPVGDALRPAAFAFHFPDALPTPRARVLVEAPGTPWSTIALWGLGGLLLLGALAFAGLGRRFSGPAPAPDITAEAAHELKTPLTAMRGELEVALRRERTPAEYRETIAGTLEEVKGLQNLVASVLLLTRGAEAPRAEEPVDMTEVVKAEAERIHLAHPDRAVALASVAGPRNVTGDPSLLARAIGNLLDNAALHSVASGAIRIRCEASKDELRVTVEDDGPGIPEARRAKVFERFYRGPDVGQRGIPGSGLGLPIARWIAEVHGGSLVLDPAVEGRARFLLRLPLAAPRRA